MKKVTYNNTFYMYTYNKCTTLHVYLYMCIENMVSPVVKPYLDSSSKLVSPHQQGIHIHEYLERKAKQHNTTQYNTRPEKTFSFKKKLYTGGTPHIFKV